LAEFGFESLRDLPDIEKLRDAGLLGRTGVALGGAALAAELRGVLGLGDEVEEDLGEEHAA
jgi:segregation and condensation protein B